MGKVFNLSLRARLLAARAELDQLRTCYEGLQKKDSEYAKDIYALLDLSQQVATIYEDENGRTAKPAENA